MSEKGTFVIQFSGKDIPGLLYTWSKALCDLDYNITDISLATGASKHTTFLRCQIEKKGDRQNEAKAEGADAGQSDNPHRERLKIQKRLEQTVRERYKEHNRQLELAVPEDEPTIEVGFDQPEDREQSFQVYLAVVFEDRKGAVSNLTDMLRGAYTINSAFSRSMFDNKIKDKRILYTEIEKFIAKRGKNLDTPKDERRENNEVHTYLQHSAGALHAKLRELSKQNLGKLTSGAKKEAKKVCDDLRRAQRDWKLEVAPKEYRSFADTYRPEIEYVLIVWGNIRIYEDARQVKFENIRKAYREQPDRSIETILTELGYVSKKADERRPNRGKRRR